MKHRSGNSGPFFLRAGTGGAGEGQLLPRSMCSHCDSHFRPNPRHLFPPRTSLFYFSPLPLRTFEFMAPHRGHFNSFYTWGPEWGSHLLKNHTASQSRATPEPQFLYTRPSNSELFSGAGGLVPEASSSRYTIFDLILGWSLRLLNLHDLVTMDYRALQ